MARHLIEEFTWYLSFQMGKHLSWWGGTAAGKHGHEAGGLRDDSTLNSELEQRGNWRWSKVIISQSPPPVVHFLQQCCPTSPHTAASWGPRVQTPEPMGDTFHSNQQSVWLKVVPKYFSDGSVQSPLPCKGVIYNALRL